MRFRLVGIVVLLGGLCNCETVDYTKYVDPLVGTEGAIPGSSLGGGNMFPGVALPFGQVKLGIDTSVLNLDQGGISSANSGYTPRGNATGFSLLHTSGTGGQPKYGVVSQMPLLGSLEEQGINVADNRTYLTNRTNEVAQVGYFRTTFERTGITTELTASQHAGVLHYTFPPSTNGTAHILIDLAHALPSGGGGYISQRYVKGELTVDPAGHGYSGSAWYDLGWNQGEAWQIFFCGNFSKPATRARTFWTPYNHLVPPTSVPTLSPYYDIYASDNLAIGTLFSWEFEPSDGLQVESRVGVSFISAQKACRFVEDEVPWTQSFNTTAQIVKDTWNREILSSITIPAENGPANDTLLGLLYTHLYGTALMPTDRTGENPGGWNSKEPYYDDWYTVSIEFSFVYFVLRLVPDVGQRFDGYLPDGRSANQNGRTQGGSNADNVLADAYIKGLDKVKSINWGDAYKAVQKDADVTPRRNIDFNAFDGGTKEGRNALPDWISLGYITKDYSRSISKGVEYAQNDFAAYLLAKSLGTKQDAARYLQRANNWKNFWNPDATVNLGTVGFGVHTGFFGSKSAQGIFDDSVNVTNCGGCTWGDLTYEGLIWEYSFNVPHDVAALINLMGGPDAFERRLDASFIEGFSAGSGPANTAGAALFNPGNEPSFQTPFLYNYINGKQYKTVEKTRYIVNKYYSLARSGIPGNQDAGAMATWLIWNVLGLYPVTTQPVYLLSAPLFRAVDLRLGTTDPASASYKSKTYLRIRAPALNANNIYVQGVKLNGKSINRSFVWHDEIVGGGTLEFIMGSKVTAWDSGELPPSISTGWKAA
ncbi:Alpha-1,2-mannosidase family protein [Ceratobasidium theobromae]|uniref:Alpha-1,2-mannosidase family protein n=1 Tax=Ceratobasidium theobromae TaxID=1582974 RepID=A0A5N5QVC6_9AGAM|nr:Alpha-1,2-mannosidase family protein [Ceratobasidium theobromae]